VQADNNSSDAKLLISFAAARDRAWAGYDAILDLVHQLPKTVAAQCNPADPDLALTVLEAECTAIACEACDVYAVWSKVGPHISTAANAE
jgi:hypothetical protein